MRISDWSSDVCSSDLGGRQNLRDVGAEGTDLLALQAGDRVAVRRGAGEIVVAERLVEQVLDVHLVELGLARRKLLMRGDGHVVRLPRRIEDDRKQDSLPDTKVVGIVARKSPGNTRGHAYGSNNHSTEATR